MTTTWSVQKFGNDPVFKSGERVRGPMGTGTVATSAYCLGREDDQIGQIVSNPGIRYRDIPVRYDICADSVFWESPYSINKL